jgi:deoxycytidylate deaminase
MDEYSALRLLTKKLVVHKDKVIDEQSKNYFVGAIILDAHGRVESVGFNSFSKSHPYQKKLSERIPIHNKREQIYLHAEISALIKSAGKGHTMIVARIGMKEHIHRLAKPCLICQEAIKQSHLKKVYFTNDFGELVLMEINV